MEDTRTEEQKRIDDEWMQKAYAEIAQAEKEEYEHNMKLLAENNIPDDDFKHLIEYCSIGRLEIVKAPTGENQHEARGVFKSVFVDQWTRGMEGDSFAGFIYGKLSKGKWIKVPYEC